MTAVESGNIELVALCLNERLNPFFKDALDRTALDYAYSFKNVQGHDIRLSIEIAMKQWEGQMSKEQLDEVKSEQLEYDTAYYGEFKS